MSAIRPGPLRTWRSRFRNASPETKIMNRRRRFFVAALSVALASAAWNQTSRGGYFDRPQDTPAASIEFFDVLEMPARIDSPAWEANAGGINLICAIANRQPEELLGMRLVLMIFDENGRYRGRINWTERAPLAGYSIEKTTLHPPGLHLRGSHDRFVLGVDEVIGRETIWRASGIEKALRAFARGQHDVIPEVRTISNKFDSRPNQLPVIPLRQEH